MSIQKYLDNTGLAYFWGKIKNWVTSRGYITSSGSITGNAATATKLGTSNVGSSVQPIYLNAGTATAVSSALKTCYGGVESEAVENTYFKIGSGSIAGSYNHLKVRILVQHLTSKDSCIWDIWLAIDSVAGVYSQGCSILFNNTGYYGTNLIVAYKSNSGGSLDFELYVKETDRYSNHRFTVIQECWRNNQKVGNILTLYNQLTSTGTATITSGYTALTTVKATVDMDISGNIATATKLATARNINGVAFDGSADITIADSTKVAKSGDTMTDRLTITNGKPLTFKHTGITRGTAPSASVYPFFVEFRDSADKYLGGLYYTYDTNRVAKTYLMCYQGTSNANTYESIGVGYDGSGNVFTWAPTPATADNSTKIATTAFVKAQGYLTSHQSLDSKMTRGSYERIEGTSSTHKDLNNYTTAGFYNVKTVNVDNCPSDIGIDAVLLVYPWDRGSYCTQELTESAASSDVRRWVRKFSGDAWSDWKQLSFSRYCMVGQSTASGTNPWYKIATAEITNANDDIITVFLVESTYGVHGYGLLQAHIRTESDKKVNTTATTFQWLSYTGINPSNFVLVCPTVASPTVEIWSKISYGYMFKRFTILSEGNRYSTTSIWTLLNANSTGQHASIATAGTQFVSQLTGLANNVTGTVAIANGGTSATTRLGAVGSFFSEAMTTSNTKSFLVVNDNFTNAGWLSVGNIKTVLGLSDYLPLAGGTLTGTLYSHYIRHKISGIDITDTTSGYVQDIPFTACDKNNKDLTALLTYRYHSEGKTVQSFRVNNKNDKSADFRFEVNDNNSFVCYATASSGMKDATSFNDDGWTYVTANWVRRHNRIVCNYGSDISKPYNCIVKTGSKITGNYADRSIILLVEKPYTIAGGLGICQVSLRTNDSNNVATCTARWLARTGNIAANCIQVGLINTPGSAACDIYYHVTGGYETVHITVLSQSADRYGNPNKAAGGFVPFAATDDDWANRRFASMNAGAQHYWSQNYSSTTSPTDENVVNSTTNSNVSDERFKTQISLLPESVLDAWDEVDFCQFKFNEAAESKGLENARLHSGLIAQQIDTIFKNHDLNASTYGFFCCDSQYEEVETQDADGNAIRNLVKVSDLYSIRYTEALCIEAAYQRHKNKILENHISELEKRLAKLEGNI